MNINGKKPTTKNFYYEFGSRIEEMCQFIEITGKNLLKTEKNKEEIIILLVREIEKISSFIIGEKVAFFFEFFSV